MTICNDMMFIGCKGLKSCNRENRILESLSLSTGPTEEEYGLIYQEAAKHFSGSHIWYNQRGTLYFCRDKEGDERDSMGKLPEILRQTIL